MKPEFNFRVFSIPEPWSNLAGSRLRGNSLSSLKDNIFFASDFVTNTNISSFAISRALQWFFCLLLTKNTETPVHALNTFIIELSVIDLIVSGESFKYCGLIQA